MKADFQVLLIILCALMPSTGYAFVSSPAAPQNAASSTPTTSNRSGSDEGTTVPLETKNHKDVTTSHQSARRQPVGGKIPLPNSASVVKANRSKMVHNNSQDPKSRSLVGNPQPTSIKPIGATKIAVTRSLPVQTVAGSGIGGGNFRNRRRTPIPGMIGGPASTTRNKATLSGTGMHNKRLN
ncbi:MAG TPA: hypothetical protein VEH30_01515 [Terriglobales bacterium]|nr:hypothetical protein [Terriglobales bacterium]